MPAETHSRRGPIDRAEIERIVREQLSEILEVDTDVVTPEARLRDDLEADDYALIELVEAVEAELGERTVLLAIDDEDLSEWRTVRDAIDCVAADALGAPATEAAAPKTAPGADRLDALETALGVHFSDRSLLLASLAHRSWCAEHEGSPSNERLEFLGDSVLGLVVTHYVFEHFPDLPEGQLSEVRAGVVNARVLAEVAQEIGLGSHLLLGKGEDAAGGRAKQSILADAFEAVVAAVYLDTDLTTTRDLVLRCLCSRIAEAVEGPGGRDYKTRLQELAAARSIGRPRYVVRDEGPDHAKHFIAAVFFGDVCFGEGDGGSKKQAEQGAAWVAWTRLQQEALEQGDGDAGAT
jgi:ribonuclease III